MLNWFRRANIDKHFQKPLKGPPSLEVEAALAARLQEVKESHYSQYVVALRDKVAGKTVIDTISGTSGFVLHFSDASWVGIFLEGGELRYWVGQGKCPDKLSKLINSTEYGNGHDPIPVNKMYASQICDIAAEISNAKGKVIEGLSIGSKYFNFCFPKNLELDTSIVLTASGKLALRVFWEQW